MPKKDKEKTEAQSDIHPTTEFHNAMILARMSVFGKERDLDAFKHGARCAAFRKLSELLNGI